MSVAQSTTAVTANVASSATNVTVFYDAGHADRGRVLT